MKTTMEHQKRHRACLNKVNGRFKVVKGKVELRVRCKAPVVNCGGRAYRDGLGTRD